jgi:hypothetical protein
MQKANRKAVILLKPNYLSKDGVVRKAKYFEDNGKITYYCYEDEIK